MKKLLSLFLCLFSLQGFAQEFADKEYYLIDSLVLEDLSEEDRFLLDSCLNEYHAAKDDTTRMHTLTKLCENLVTEDWMKYQFYQCEELQELRTNTASEEIKAVLQYDYAGALNNIGLIYYEQAKVSEALDYYSRSLKILEELEYKPGISGLLHNFALIYKDQGLIEQALEANNRSLKISEELDDKYGIASSLHSIGSIYDEKKELEKSLEYYNRSLKLYKEIGDRTGEALSFNNIGSLKNLQGEIEVALNYLDSSLIIYEEIGHKAGIASSLSNIGNIHYDQGQIDQALGYALKSLKIAQEIDYPQRISWASILLSEVYEAQGKGLQALEMYKLHVRMKDSMNNEETQRASAQQQARYEYEKQKVIDDAENDKLLAIEQEAKAKQRVISFSIAGGLGLVGIFLLFVMNRLKVTRKQKAVIEEQKDEVEEAHREITDSINYAERIQRSFLASKELLDENLNDYFVFFQPKEAVSGDFYWAGKLNNGNFAVVNADSTGHGVPGAIMSILNISSIESAVKDKLCSPADIFNDCRKTIIERLKKDGSKEGGKDGMDASIICFDFEQNKFTYTAAQNPIWVIRDGELTEIKPEKMPIGKHDKDHIPFVGGEFETLKGDQIYTLTDGFQDQFGGPRGKKFMIKKMREYVLSISNLPMEEQHQKIKETFTNWKGEMEQVDDICVIGVKI